MRQRISKRSISPRETGWQRVGGAPGAVFCVHCRSLQHVSEQRARPSADPPMHTPEAQSRLKLHCTPLRLLPTSWPERPNTQMGAE
jgi:hypothetical protein